MSEIATVAVLRPDPGLGPVGAPNRARRCLFGPPDPEATRQVLQSETERIYRLQKQAWNFDFEREMPLEGGRFVWKLLQKSNSAEDSEDSRNSEPSSRRSKLAQTKMTDFMRKRKLSANHRKKETAEPKPKKMRRRNST